MPENLRQRSANSDTNQMFLDQIALSVFADMGIIGIGQYNAVRGDVQKQIELLQSVKDLKGEQAEEFSERFIDKIMSVNEQWFDLVPPATLAKAYIGTKKKLADNNLNDDNRQYFQDRLNKISGRIDSLINDFATSVGYHFADPTNIADVYAGYNEMFDAREPDLDENSDLIRQIQNNRIALQTYMTEYDSINGISNINESQESVDSLDENWDVALTQANKYVPSDSTLTRAAKYKFLDKNNQEIPQFKNENGESVSDYKKGYKLDENGRLAGVVDLARQEYAMQHAADNNVKNAVKKDIQQELDNDVLYKLFEIDTAEKIVNGAMEDPTRFTDPAQFQNFVNNLDTNGGQISDAGYEAAMDAQVNKTAGFASRIKQKLGKFASKATGFFGKVFKPIQKIDKRANDRIKGQTPKDKRQQRIEFFVRMLKGFGSAFLVSAAITTIATAAAAVAGVGLAVSIASIGVVTGITLSALQIHNWRKAQRAAGKDDGIGALLKDKRMLASLGTTAIASIAMIFGAAGVTTAAVTLGYGALALGGTNNTINTYKDAKAAGMGTAESIAWALANAVAVIAGGIGGRMTANALINSYNQSHPDNELFQQKESHQEYQKTGEHEEHELVYKQETLDNAERIAKMWYRDNPDLLQQRVDMVNAYNAEHGTNIDPYRAIVISADAGGMTADNMALHVDGGGVVHSGAHHTVLTRQWGLDHGFSMEEINAMRHMFDGGHISDAAINAAMKADAMISPINEVGVVSQGDAPHYDGVLHQNTVDRNGVPVFNTYAGGDSPFDVHTNVVDDFGWVNVDTLTPTNVPWGLGMFGVYNRKHEAELKDRPGAKADKTSKIDIKPLPFVPKPIPLPPHKNKGLLPNKERLALPEHKEMPALPEHKEILALPEHVEDEDKKQTTSKPKWLRISRADAYDIWAKGKDIEREEAKLADQKLKESERQKIKARKKKWEQELRERKNKIGNPSESILDDAMYWAFRKEDLEKAREELAKLEQRKITANTGKHERKEIEDGTAYWKAKIAEFEAEIPDESLFYDPVPVQYNKESKTKVAVFKQGTLKLKQKKQISANGLSGTER